MNDSIIVNGIEMDYIRFGTGERIFVILPGVDTKSILNSAMAIKAVEAVDVCVGRVVEALKEVNGQMFICADHGNCDKMVDEKTGEPFTAHSTNPVPFIIVNADPKYGLKEGGRLCDIVPTIIEMMGLEKPAEMTGISLLVEK